MSGDRSPVASPRPQAPAARPPDTRRRIASFARHHPKAHRDRFFAAPAAQNDSSTPRADWRHPQACSQHYKHGVRNTRPIAPWYGEIYGLALKQMKPHDVETDLDRRCDGPRPKYGRLRPTHSTD